MEKLISPYTTSESSSTSGIANAPLGYVLPYVKYIRAAVEVTYKTIVPAGAFKATACEIACLRPS
jgi:hypothetical protein